MQEDNGVAVGKYDGSWTIPAYYCKSTNYRTGYVCTLSRGHASPHHVGHGGEGKVVDRWLDENAGLKVGAGL